MGLTISIGLKINIIISIALIMTLSLLWRIHADDKNLEQEKLHLWQQPLSLNEHFPERLSSSSWRFDFDEVEQVLLSVKQDEMGELIVNETTAKILENAVTKLPSNMQDAELHRIEFLISKGLQRHDGQQLAKLLIGFYRLQQFTVNSNEVVQSLKAKEKRFEETVFHQELYLDKAFAEKLFGRQNSVTRYLYQRLHIQQDQNLTQEQKQQQLDIHQRRFKASEY